MWLGYLRSFVEYGRSSIVFSSFFCFSVFFFPSVFVFCFPAGSKPDSLEPSCQVLATLDTLGCQGAALSSRRRHLAKVGGLPSWHVPTSTMHSLLAWSGGLLRGLLLCSHHVCVGLLLSSSLLHDNLVSPGHHGLDHSLLVRRQLSREGSVVLRLLLLQSCSTGLAHKRISPSGARAGAHLLIITDLKS
jgi:hypothetical protein